MINPRKWVSYIKGTIASFVLRNTMSHLLEAHVVEQLAFRMIRCPECAQGPFCIDCGCNMPDKMLVVDEKCSLKKWGPMILDKQEYLEHKKTYGIDLKPFINNKIVE